MFRNQNNRIVEVRRRSTRGIVSEQSKGHAKRSSRSEQVSVGFRIGSEEKYNSRQFATLTPEQAKELTARGLPDSRVVRQLLEWIAELEKRPDKK